MQRKLFLVALLIVTLIAALMLLPWPFGGMPTPQSDVLYQSSLLKASLKSAFQQSGATQEEIISRFPKDTNGITSALREILCVEDGADHRRKFLKDRHGNDILIFRNTDVPENEIRTWMRGCSNLVYVWGIGSNERNEWGEGDDVVIDFEGLSVLR